MDATDPFETSEAFNTLFTSKTPSDVGVSPALSLDEVTDSLAVAAASLGGARGGSYIPNVCAKVRCDCKG